MENEDPFAVEILLLSHGDATLVTPGEQNCIQQDHSGVVMNYRFIFNPSSQLRPAVIVSTCMAVSEVLRKILCKLLAEAPSLCYQRKQMRFTFKEISNSYVKPSRKLALTLW